MREMNIDLDLFRQQISDLKAQGKKFYEVQQEVNLLLSLIDTIKNELTPDEGDDYLKCLEEQGWESRAFDLWSSIQRWQKMSLMPVSVGIMGKMSVGKTTVLMEILDPPEDSPVRKMPTRSQETTACAVRWIDENNFESRMGIPTNIFKVDDFSVEGQTPFYISIAGAFEKLPQSLEKYSSFRS